MDTNFKPGMVVAYVEKRHGHVIRVICLDHVKTVGKRDIKLTHNNVGSRFKANGQTWERGVYGFRWIMPLTRDLYEQAINDRATGMDRIPAGFEFEAPVVDHAAYQDEHLNGFMDMGE